MNTTTTAQATTTETGTYEGKTAAQWRAETADQNRRNAESWDRSDTDGFMSQWAHGINAREAELKAQLAERGAWTTHLAVFDLDGNLVDAEVREGKFGACWMLLRNGRCAGWFYPSNAKNEKTRRANNAKKGYYEGRVKVPAVVDIRGGSITSVHAGIYIADDQITGENVLEVLDNGR